MSGLRIGYAFWGYLSDRKLAEDGTEVSSPDGNATYSWAIVHEAVRRGHTVIPLHQRRDVYATSNLGDQAFKAFSKRKRSRVYDHLMWGPQGRKKRRRITGWGADSDRTFPELDLVLLEWRWPIPGRNTVGDRGTLLYQSDLDRQDALLRHYTGKGVPVIAWDLDHRLTEEDERTWQFRAVFETAVQPRHLHLRRTRVEPPFVMEDLLQLRRSGRPTVTAAYVGSRYERDDVLDEWIGPLAKMCGPGQVHFFGKWEPLDECRRRWPGVVFHGRVGVAGFHEAYRNAAVCPLLAKRSYMENGFITPRPWEAVLFGSLPIGLNGHLGIEKYSFAVVYQPDIIKAIAEMVKSYDTGMMLKQREFMAERLAHMDARYFVDALEAAHAGTETTDTEDTSKG